MKKSLALLLAALFLFGSLFTACKFSCSGKKDNDPTAAPVNTDVPATDKPVDATDEPSDSEEPVPSDVPATDAPSSESQEAFDAIADEIFISYLTSDGLTYHQFVIDPANFGLTEDDIERGWGDFSYEAHVQGCEENAEIKARLEAIDREQLDDASKLAYDNICEAIELSDSVNDYFYYSEPLSPFNGYHTMLPMMMPMYDINTAEDASNYLILLEDMPRYLAQITQFEIEKADHGLFMTENALDQVIESCNKFAAEGENCFLIDFFEEAIEKDGIELSADEKADMLRRNRSCVLDQILPEYTTLSSTLESLRPECRSFEGAAAHGEDEKRYFELQIRSEAACMLSCDEMAELIEDRALDMLNKLYQILLTDPTAFDSFGQDFTSGSAETDVEYLLSLIRDLYPTIPEQSIEYVNIPDAVAEDFSPAAYLISAFDDPSRNVVLFNPTADTRTLLFTLAHECFPGHLYQTQYFRNSTIPQVQQVMAPTGYLEGWAVFSEFMIAKRAQKYGVNASLLEKYNGIITNILIPGYISIKVNYDGWTKSSINQYLSGYGLDQDEYVDILYEYAVNVPLYFFNYTMGIVNTLRIYDSVAPKNDSQLSDFLARYLSYGPCYYDILNREFGITD